MANRVHFFLGEELGRPETQRLDDDEYVDVELVPQETVFRGMGKAPYLHALMGTALAFYFVKRFPAIYAPPAALGV